MSNNDGFVVDKTSGRYDNDTNTLSHDRHRLDAGLCGIAPGLCVTGMGSDRDDALDYDYFVLHSVSLQHRPAIEAWMRDNLCDVQYRLEEGEWNTHEMETHGNTQYRMARKRRTLRVCRESYVAMSLCPSPRIYFTRLACLLTLGASVVGMRALLSMRV